jgi:serine/threonine protein kinase
MSHNTGTQNLGKYDLLETVGKSDLAVVYRAVDTDLGREVALKVLDSLWMQDTDWVHRFRQDFQAIVRLQHPHIVTIYDVDEAAGKLYIAMQLARGGNFARAMRKQGQVPWNRVLSLLEPVCEALDYAHNQGVVHGDLKPTNILVDPKAGPLLTDFGFVRLLRDNAESASIGGGILGTPAYIAPEAWEAHAAEAPADIYALGCIVYEMLLAEVLFEGDSVIEIMRAHAEGPDFPATWPNDIPGGLADVLHKALAWESQERYRDAMSFWRALSALSSIQQPPTSTQPPAPQPATLPHFTFSTLPDHQVGSLVDPMTPEQFLGTQGHLGYQDRKDTYKARLNNQDMILTWCFPPHDTDERRTALARLIQKGVPGDAYLWPSHIVESQDAPGFGYLMPGLPSNAIYVSLDDVAQRWGKWSSNVQPTFRTLTTVALALVDSFLALHLHGLCFRNISADHLFFDPKTGELYISYDENIVMSNQAEVGTPRTLRFAAPELIREEAPPSVQTDLYTLATLLFVIFMGHHPLEGEKATVIPTLDRSAMRRLYGTAPLFVFDPDNPSNRPVPGYHVEILNNWPIYPQFIGDLLTRAFTEGISDPHGGRVRVSEWRGALIRLRDSIFYCAQCGVENFYDLEALKKSGGRVGNCWSCGSTLRLPPRLRIEQDLAASEVIIMLNHDTYLFPHHLDSEKPYDFSVPLAEVNQHPSNPNIWGLKNLGAEKWVMTTSEGIIKDVEPGRNVTLAKGTRINFGKREGEITM